MRLAVISDIHDNLWNLQRAIQQIENAADMLFCCGDLCSPFVIDELAKFTSDIHIVFGNNDADLFRISAKVRKNAQIHLHGELFEGTVDGKRIAMHHFDNVARPLAKSGSYDAVFFGHNHQFEVVSDAGCLLINPGPIMGAKFPSGVWEDTQPMYVIFETRTSLIQAFTLDAALVSSFGK